MTLTRKGCGIEGDILGTAIPREGRKGKSTHLLFGFEGKKGDKKNRTKLSFCGKEGEEECFHHPGGMGKLSEGVGMLQKEAEEDFPIKEKRGEPPVDLRRSTKKKKKKKGKTILFP